MFSVVSVCHPVYRGCHVTNACDTIGQWEVTWTPGHVQTCSNWHQPQPRLPWYTCSNLFTWGPPPPMPCPLYPFEPPNPNPGSPTWPAQSYSICSPYIFGKGAVDIRQKCLFVYFTPMMPGCSPCESPWFRFRFFPDCLAISTFLDIFIIDNSKLTMVCQEWQYKRFWLCQWW